MGRRTLQSAFCQQYAYSAYAQGSDYGVDASVNVYSKGGNFKGQQFIDAHQQPS